MFPWDFIHAGANKGFLKNEYKKMFKEDSAPVPDCKWGDCQKCGIPGNGLDTKLAAAPERYQAKSRTPEEIKALAAERASRRRDGVFPYHLVYRKSGLSRFIAHQATLDLFEKGFRRLKIPLNYSEGFNPRPVIKNTGALPLGLESRQELLVIEFRKPLAGTPEEQCARLTAVMPDGHGNRLRAARRSARRMPRVETVDLPLRRRCRAASRGAGGAGALPLRRLAQDPAQPGQGRGPHRRHHGRLDRGRRAVPARPHPAQRRHHQPLPRLRGPARCRTRRRCGAVPSTRTAYTVAAADAISAPNAAGNRPGSGGRPGGHMNDPNQRPGKGEDLGTALERLDLLLAETKNPERLRMGMGIRLALGMAQELRQGAALGSQTADLVAAWTEESWPGGRGPRRADSPGIPPQARRAAQGHGPAPGPGRDSGRGPGGRRQDEQTALPMPRSDDGRSRWRRRTGIAGLSAVPSLPASIDIGTNSAILLVAARGGGPDGGPLASRAPENRRPEGGP